VSRHVAKLCPEGTGVGETSYLKHRRDWTMTRDAIVRLAARLGRPFTYGELSAEIEEHEGLKIDRRGYGAALEAVAVNLSSTEPIWTSMVCNADSGEPGGRILEGESR